MANEIGDQAFGGDFAPGGQVDPQVDQVLFVLVLERLGKLGGLPGGEEGQRLEDLETIVAGLFVVHVAGDFVEAADVTDQLHGRCAQVSGPILLNIVALGKEAAAFK